MPPSNKTKCDSCKRAKNPIIYLRTSKKVCMGCWQAEKETNKSLINSMVFPVNQDAPLGWNWVGTEWFSDEKKGQSYADWAYTNFGSAVV